MTTTKTPTAIRLSVTPEIRRALRKAKYRYPTLTDAEIFKLGLSKVIVEDDATQGDEEELEEIRAAAAQAVGYDYLSDPEEDIYTEGMGEKVDFS